MDKKIITAAIILFSGLVFASIVIAVEPEHPKYCIGPWIDQGTLPRTGSKCDETCQWWDDVQRDECRPNPGTPCLNYIGSLNANAPSISGYKLAQYWMRTCKPHCDVDWQSRVIYIEPGERGANIYCPPLDNIVSFTTNAPSPPNSVPQNGAFTISWDAPFAHSCTLSGKAPEVGSISWSWSGKESRISGSKTYDLVQRGIYNFQFTCTGYRDNQNLGPEKGTATRKLTIYAGDIPPPPTVSLSVEPTEIKKGESATLSWTSENADSLSINQSIGRVRPSGSIKVSPQFTTRYTITAAPSSEFPELGLARDSVTLRVTAPKIAPIEEIPEVPEEAPPVIPPAEPEKPALDLKINGQDGPLTFTAPASFTLSWNLNQYCVAHGSWFGIKTKAGEERRTEKKPGTYTYKLYCPGTGSDSVTVNVVGYEKTVSVAGAAAAVPMPVAEASVSLDGKNFSKSVRVVRGEPVNVWLSAAYDVTGDKKASRDDSGRWTSALSFGGRCEWNYDLNQGTPTFEAVTFDPQTAEECVIPLGELTFYDQPGVYRYGVLRLVQNDGKVSNIGYVSIAVHEPPPPDTPPVIDLRINDLEGPVTLGAPAEYVISWKTRNADSCVASDDWKGDKFLAGSEKYVASSKRELVYTLTCVGKLGTTVKSIELKVAELPVCEFSALPTSLSKSVFVQQSVLSWKCQFANSCSISPSVGEVDTFGSTRVSPKTTTKYTLTCQNLEGSSSFSQTVEVR